MKCHVRTNFIQSVSKCFFPTSFEKHFKTHYFSHPFIFDILWHLSESLKHSIAHCLSFLRGNFVSATYYDAYIPRNFDSEPQREMITNQITCKMNICLLIVTCGHIRTDSIDSFFWCRFRSNNFIS